VDSARKQIMDFLAVAGEAAADNRIMIAIEPLNRKECNILNSVPEALSYADALGAPNVRVLADFYHIDEDGQPFSDVVDAGDGLAHVHVADTGRKHPGSGEYDYDAFLGALKQIGYDARISVECIFDDLARDGESAQKFLRAKWRETLRNGG
jgi:sugar phosphate isomerase/epimerase